MSFSSDVKQELNKSNSLADKEIVKFELMGYLITSNCVLSGKNLKFSTESDYNINRFSKLLTNLNFNHDIDIAGKTFYITVKISDLKKIENLDISNDRIVLKENVLKNEQHKRAIIRGSFLGAGSINNPEKKYHLEVSLSNEENLCMIKKLLKEFEINVKELIMKNKYSIYIKEGEEISKFLALIGANKAVMKFEDIRVQKEMRGKINRLVNCESANLNKTINASIEQIAAINKLKENGTFNKLDESLKEIANLRLENPNMPLAELGKLLKNPIGKSGVNYRLKKIMEIADEK